MISSQPAMDVETVLIPIEHFRRPIIGIFRMARKGFAGEGRQMLQVINMQIL